MEKRLTDNEIIKAFKMHLLDNRDCELCPYGPAYYRCDIILLKDVLDLINRLQAELKVSNEALNNSIKLNNRLQAQNKDLAETVHNLTLEKDALFDKAEELKAEVERLKECPKCVYEYDGEITEYCVQGPCSNFKTVEQLKDEAVKECLAKVKNYIKTHCNPYGKPDFDYDTSIKILNFIGNLIKEMTGERDD